ncbi:alpha-hydroxy acid oxidase [Marinoscillum furvescens]|uniref:L-lactate dehydrogenase (Cytochrome) n=1 Tax=Marinoscillum furvescens DSM 4134 TaxID=1122208 RepID=A0A3D9LGD8_MARFU|nr:alpha-hydroxy acid oxidase [Marinoscillum furvescens]REE05524.1 L-lactate dehydrogenase (cytochrome) [Marinoscillum furvescens DSM 4134]
MKEYINSNYPDIPYLRERARKRIPRFAFEYLDGGCNAEVNLKRNTDEIRDLQLKPYYLREVINPSLEVELMGKTYAAPFGIAPIGLQGLMWPRASEILAKAAFEHNIPYILSTVGTASLEKISEITEGNAWFQLYHPAEDSLRKDLLDRAAAAEYPVLVVLADVPTFGYRSKEIINGLSIPPKLTLRNILQIMGCPKWAIHTLLAGTPEFKTLKPYIPKGMSLKHLGLFMNKTFDGRLNEDRLKAIRDQWKGKLVMKGVASTEDVEKCVKLGLDGVIVSNHGGRQLDHGESSIGALHPIVEQYKDQIAIMMDSGIRTGPDIASSLAAGAEFAFLGRSFMYGVSALGSRGGDHTISILKKQLYQVMSQLCCAQPQELSHHLIKS